MKSIVSLGTSFVALALCLGTARASDPVGVYAFVDKVVLEPNAEKPESIQISGVFAMAKSTAGGLYEDPQRGYLYFKLPADKQDLVRKEWADLKEVAGTRQVVGFASRYMMKARVRKADEKPEAPDVYPLGWGVVKMRSDTDYAPVKSLVESSNH